MIEPILFRNLQRNILTGRFIIPIVVILLAIFGGVAFGQGRQKTVLILLLGLTYIYFFVLNSRGRLLFLLMGLFFSLVTKILGLPYGLTLGEGILVLLAVWQLFYGQKLSSHFSKRPIIVLCTFLAFAFIGLILNIYHNDLKYWHIVSLTPVLWLFLTMQMIRTPKQALLVIKSVLLLIVGFVFFIWLAEQTGLVIQHYGPVWRFGGDLLAFGPIVHYVYSVHLGGLVALGVPLSIMLLIREGEILAARIFYGLSLVLFLVVLITTAARGPTIAAVISAIIILLLLAKLNAKTIFILGVIAIILFLVFSSLSNQLANQWARLSTLKNASDIGTAKYRMDILSMTIREIVKNPLGGGYENIWNRYGYLDEANIYTPILNGTGVIGFALFLVMLLQMGQVYVSHLFQARKTWEHEFAALGLCVLIAELIAGISAHNLILNTKDAFVFWSILSASYCALQLGHRT